MYAIWKSPDKDALIGVVGNQACFLAWSKCAVYRITQHGKMIDKFPLHDEPRGAPTTASDEDPWLIATNTGFRNKNVSSSSTNIKELERIVCSVGSNYLLTDENIVNVETGEHEPHKMETPRGALFFKDALVIWGPSGLRVGKSVVSSKSVLNVWRVSTGLWFEEEGYEKKRFWNAYMHSEEALDIGCCSIRHMVIRDALHKRVVVRSSLGTGEVVDYKYFDSFSKEHALAINSVGNVAGILNGGEIVIFDEKTRFSQAGAFCMLTVKFFVGCMIVIFIFSIFT